MEEPFMTEEQSELTSQEIRKRTVKSAGALISLGVFLRLFTRFRTLLVIPYLVASDFGLKSLSISIFSFAGMAMWGFGTNVLTEKKDIEQMYSVHTAFMFGFTTTIAFVIILFRNSLANLFDAPLLGKILVVTMSANTFFALGTGASLKLAREIRQTRIAMVNTIANGLDLIITFSLAFSGYGVWSLVFGPIAGKTFATISFLSIARVPSKWFIWAQVVRYFKGGINYNILAIMAVILYDGANFIVGLVSGINNLGYYTLARGIAVLLTGVIVDPITSVTLPAYARMDSKSIAIGIRRTLEFISIILVGLSLIGIITIKFLIVFLYGEEWLPVADIAQTALVLSVIAGIVRIFHNYLMSQKETNFLVRVRVFQIGILFCMGIPLTYYIGPIGMIIGQISHQSVALFFEGKFIGKKLRKNLIKESLYPASTAGLLTIGIVSMSLYLFDISTLEIVILIFLVYGIGIALTGRNAVVELSKLIKKSVFGS